MKLILMVRTARCFSGRAVQSLCLALLIGAMAGQAQGAGFSLHEHSLKAVGSAYAGAGTNAGDEAATIFWNPAGMSFVEGRQVQVGTVYFTSTLEFKNEGSNQSFLTPGGVLQSPSRGPSDDGEAKGLIPNFFGVIDLNERLKLGLGIYAPFGLSTEYDPNWVGRYHAIDSSINTISINPALSYRVTDRLTVGAGLSANYIDSELSQAVFVFDPLSGSQLPDGFGRVDADDWGYAFNLGLIQAFDDGSRIGLSYRSKIDHSLDGDRLLTGVGPFSGQVGARADLTLPESLVASGYKRLNDHWSIMGDVIWTRWSRLDELRIRFNDASADDVTRFGWDDSWRFGLGAEYRMDEQWSFRGGVAFDQSPIPNAKRRTPRLPGSDRRWITLGTSYRASDALSLDFAYAYVKLDDASIHNSVDLTGGAMPGFFTDTLIGSYSSDSHIVGIEISFDL